MITRDEFKAAINNFAELLDLTDAIISCDICGDCHNINEVPFVCQTGDGV